MEHSAIEAFRPKVLRNLSFPTVPILKQLLFVIQKFLHQWRNIRIILIHLALTAYDSAKIMHTNLVSFRCKLKVGSFNNGIYRARLLAESTIDTLCHVNIIPSSPTATIFSFLRFNGDCLCRTYLINDNSLLRLKCHTQLPSHIKFNIIPT